ncbi:glycosyltransferase family 4 protein [Marinobacter sp. 1Y8]
MEYKLLGVCDQNPFSPLTWSGSANHFFSEIRNRGLLEDAISSDPSFLNQKIIQLKNFHGSRDKWRFAYHLSPDLFAARTQSALNKVNHKNLQFDAFMQIGAWFDFTGYGKPAFSYHDGNLACRLNSPYSYPAISRSRVKRALDYEKKLYSRMEIIFPMSNWLKNSFVKDFGVHADKVFPVYAGINMPEVTEYIEPRYDAKNILFVGKSFQRKGGGVLLEAFKIVRKVIPNASLTIVGPTLKDLPEGVFNPGFVSKESPEGMRQLQDLYRKASIFALPTLYEPFGIAFAEAMAHGLPCVGTNICAIPEIITDQKTGFLVEPNSANDLAHKLINLLENPQLCKEMGVSGFNRYRADFNWRSVVSKIDSVIRSVK